MNGIPSGAPHSMLDRFARQSGLVPRTALHSTRWGHHLWVYSDEHGSIDQVAWLVQMTLANLARRHDLNDVFAQLRAGSTDHQITACCRENAALADGIAFSCPFCSANCDVFRWYVFLSDNFHNVAVTAERWFLCLPPHRVRKYLRRQDLNRPGRSEVNGMEVRDLSAWLPGRSAKWLTGLSHLLEAACYAQDLGNSEWEFSVDCGLLSSAGLTMNDILWLLARGHLEYARSDADLVTQRKLACHKSAQPALATSSRFVLTTTGIDLALLVCQASPSCTKNDRSPITHLDSDEGSLVVPRWDCESRALWFGNAVIKEFKVPAGNQEAVLNAFEEDGWPPFIDDPLPPRTGIDSKRRLHDTIIRLNRSHRHDFVRFHGNGNGLAAHWERVTRHLPRG
jgi:hypothetical protein